MKGRLFVTGLSLFLAFSAVGCFPEVERSPRALPTMPPPSPIIELLEGPVIQATASYSPVATSLVSPTAMPAETPTSTPIPTPTAEDTPTPTVSPAPTVAYDYAGWGTYLNPNFGYQVRFPADVIFLEDNDGSKVSFDGPPVDNEPWPAISVSHYDSDFYRPPADTDVSQWVLSFGIPHDEVGPLTFVGGLPAVHLIVNPTPQSYGFDEFYFIKDEQLYRILFLHTGGRQDWDLYDQFLRGFSFEEDPEADEDLVEAWLGFLGRYPPGFQSAYYFDRDDGQRFIVGGLDEDVNQQIAEAAWLGSQVELWGELTEMPDFINISRLEQLSGSTTEARNLAPFASASASSELPADRLGSYQAWAAIDGLMESPWCEGATRTGVGEWIMLEFPSPIQLQTIVVTNGYDYNEEIFYSNNRIKRGGFAFSEGELEWEFEDTREPQRIEIGDEVTPNLETSMVKLVIADNYPGSRYDDTCVAEIELWGTPK